MIASSSPGTESVAVSPVASTSADEVRPRDLAHVEPREHRIRQMHEPDPEPVATGCVDSLDEAGRGKRAELTRHRARRHARAARQFVRADLAAFCKGVEHSDRPLGSANSTCGRLTSARHECRFVAESGTALLKVQFKP